MSSIREKPGREEKPLQGLETACATSIDVLPDDMEYPPCPSCDKNLGLFTQISENSDRLHCVKCGERFGSKYDITTTRDLPRPVRDDFVACIVGDAEPEDQAEYRGIDVVEVQRNLSRAGELLSRDWVEEWKERRAGED